MHRHRKTVDLKCQRQLEINQIAQRTFCAAGKENVRIKSRSRNGDLYEYYEFDCRGTRQKDKSKRNLSRRSCYGGIRCHREKRKTRKQLCDGR